MSERQENECAFCHRHVETGIACHEHRAGNKMSGSKTQRALYASTLQAEEATFSRRIRADPALFGQIASLATSPDAIVQVLALSKTHFEEPVHLLMDQVLAGTSKPAPRNPFDTVLKAWYGSAEISDPRGLFQARTAGESAPLVFFHDLIRANAFVKIGGDSPKGSRRPRTSPETRSQIAASRRAGNTYAQIATALGIPLSTVTAICRKELPGFVATSRRTSAPKAVKAVKASRKPPSKPTKATRAATAAAPAASTPPTARKRSTSTVRPDSKKPAAKRSTKAPAKAAATPRAAKTTPAA
jgi:hypothetical protein